MLRLKHLTRSRLTALHSLGDLQDCSSLSSLAPRNDVFAFTLAEVLVTLGIIGVVVAMTIPTLIAKQRSYVLHNQFKKSYAVISQAVMDTKNSLGVSGLLGVYTAWDSVNGYYNANEFVSEFWKTLKIVKKVDPYTIKNYNATKENMSSNDFGGDNPKPYNVLPDGSSVGVMVNNLKIRLWVDVNGPQKMPNRYGFDVFEFEISDNTDMVRPIKTAGKYTEDELDGMTWPDIAGYPCDKISKQRLNGMGCSWFAVNDINPDDENKKYWDSLPW